MAPASFSATLALVAALAAIAAPVPSPARVFLRTEQGPIELLVDTAHAPKTAANFLRSPADGQHLTPPVKIVSARVLGSPAP